MNALDLESPSQYSTSALDAAQLPAEVERLAATIVAAQLRARFADAQGDCAPADAIAGLRPSYGRWLEVSLSVELRDVLDDIYKAHET